MPRDRAGDQLADPRIQAAAEAQLLTERRDTIEQVGTAEQGHERTEDALARSFDERAHGGELRLVHRFLRRHRQPFGVGRSESLGYDTGLVGGHAQLLWLGEESAWHHSQAALNASNAAAASRQRPMAVGASAGCASSRAAAAGPAICPKANDAVR